jgi:TetR/AcrR family transcriptional repressor of uid operon
VKTWLRNLLQAAVEHGDIPAEVDLDGAVTMLMIIADGVWWRRALDPAFDPVSVVPVFMDIVRHMLRARPAPARANPRDNEETSR